MPKNPSTLILKRWRTMDAELASLFGLSIRRFAKQWKVSEKTIRRDLKAFMELGQRVQWVLELEKEYRWIYEGGCETLFVRNLSPKVRAAVIEVLANR